MILNYYYLNIYIYNTMNLGRIEPIMFVRKNMSYHITEERYS